MKAALDLTWKRLEPLARQVAPLLSYFALDWVEWDLVEWVMRVECETYRLGVLKARLENASLVQFDADRLGWCRLHPPLVQQYLQEEEEEIAVQTMGEDALRSAFVAGISEIASWMPDSPPTKEIEWFKLVRSHVQEVAEHHTVELEEEDITWSFIALSRFYEGQRLYQQAEDSPPAAVTSLHQFYNGASFEIQVHRSKARS